MTPRRKEPDAPLPTSAGPARLDSDSDTEGEIVARVRAGDRAAFAELVRRYHGRLFRLALGFVHDETLAEEVVQDTWVGVLDGLGAFEARAKLKTWIFRILMNRARTRRAREGRTIPFSALPGHDAEEGGGGGVDPARFDTRGMWKDPPHAWEARTPEELLRRNEAVRAMEETVAGLSEGQRAVITLRDLEGIGPEETCNLLGISMTNQRVLLHRARTKVRETLERHFHGGEPC